MALLLVHRISHHCPKATLRGCGSVPSSSSFSIAALVFFRRYSESHVRLISRRQRHSFLRSNFFPKPNTIGAGSEFISKFGRTGEEHDREKGERNHSWGKWEKYLPFIPIGYSIGLISFAFCESRQPGMQL